jgi:metallo-beta-lactamase class B
MYMVWGKRESSSLNREVVRMVDSLAAAGWSIRNEVDTLSKADGQHAEWFWKREFPAAYRALFQNAPTGTPPAEAAPTLSVFPNPGHDSEGYITVSLGDVHNRVVDVVDGQGRTVLNGKLKHGQVQLDTRSLPNGAYGIRVALPKKTAYKAWVKG